MELYDLKNLVKEKTCFKSVETHSCVDLFLTNCSRSFQNTNVISTSDHHKMIITVLKLHLRKQKAERKFFVGHTPLEIDSRLKKYTMGDFCFFVVYKQGVDYPF